jgi:hypothetical protein
MKIKLKPSLAYKMRASNDRIAAILILQEAMALAGVWFNLAVKKAIMNALWQIQASDIDHQLDWLELQI